MRNLSKWWSQRRTLTFSFKPSLQLREGYARTRATFFMIRRGFAILTPAIFRPLYLAVVRPHLDCAVHASFLYFQKNIKLIERMQRLATRRMKNFSRLLYPECLHEVKLPSMERHFRRATLITMYKLFHGYLSLSARNLLNRDLQVTSKGTHSRFVNHVFILPGGNRFLLYVWPDRGIDCLHTSLGCKLMLHLPRHSLTLPHSLF